MTTMKIYSFGMPFNKKPLDRISRGKNKKLNKDTEDSQHFHLLNTSDFFITLSFYLYIKDKVKFDTNQTLSIHLTLN